LTKEAKEEYWFDFLADLETDPDPSKVWQIIRKLSGTPDTNSPNEAMHDNGCVITSDEKKADLFAQHYASVSYLAFTKQGGTRNRMAKKVVNIASVDDISCIDITWKELCDAIAHMPTKGAAGPEDIFHRPFSKLFVHWH